MNRNWTILLAVFVLAAIGIGAGDGARSPAARVLELKGKATIVDPENFDRPAALFSILYANDRLTVDKGATVTLVFRGDGHVERAAAGALTVTPDGCQPKTGVERVVMSEQARSVVGKVSTGAKGIIQGGVVVARQVPQVSSPPQDSDAASVVAAPGQCRPILGSTLLTTKPVFSWPAVPKAKKYTLNVYSQGSRVWSASSDATRAEYSGETPLKSDASYLWQVTTTVGDKTAMVCESVFRIASDQQRADAEAIEKLIVKPEVPYLALAALWYKQNEFVTEAIAVHQQLAKLTNDPAVYWALSDLCWQAGREEDARAAEETATEIEKKSEGGKAKTEPTRQ